MTEKKYEAYLVPEDGIVGFRLKEAEWGGSFVLASSGGEIIQHVDPKMVGQKVPATCMIEAIADYDQEGKLMGIELIGVPFTKPIAEEVADEEQEASPDDPPAAGATS